MRFGANISYTHSIQNAAAGGFAQAFNTAPIYPLYLRDTNGKIMQDKMVTCTISEYPTKVL